MQRISNIFSPGTMDIYLAKTFAIRYCVILIGLVGTLQALDLLAQSDNVMAGKGAVTSDLWKYVTLRLSGIASLFSPFVALLASILTLSAFNIHSEIVVMKAAGWSAFRILLPLMLMSSMIGGLHFVFSETINVPAKAELKNWKEHDYAANIPSAPDTVYDTWNIDRNNLVKAEKASRIGGIVVLDKVSQYIRNKNREITGIIFANFAFFREGQWKLFEVKYYDIKTLKTTDIEDMVWNTTIPPERFIAMAIKADQVNYVTLNNAITQLKKEGRDTSAFETQMYQKFTAPLSTILMPLLAGLAAFGMQRGGSLFARIGLTLAMGFGYFVVNNLFVALGQYGAVPPFIGAWLPFVLFTLTGLSFIFVTEE